MASTSSAADIDPRDEHPHWGDGDTEDYHADIEVAYWLGVVRRAVGPLPPDALSALVRIQEIFIETDGYLKMNASLCARYIMKTSGYDAAIAERDAALARAQRAEDVSARQNSAIVEALATLVNLKEGEEYVALMRIVRILDAAPNLALHGTEGDK